MVVGEMGKSGLQRRGESRGEGDSLWKMEGAEVRRRNAMCVYLGRAAVRSKQRGVAAKDVEAQTEVLYELA